MKSHPVNPSNLSEIISNAWKKTLARVCNTPNLMCKPSKARNRDRAKVWVDALAQEFEVKYSSPDCYVFWKSNPRKKNPMRGKLKEFLFDITVCRLEVTDSLRQETKELKFVSQADWLVESEFTTRTRGIILDMSKLAIGASSYKLFVAAHRKKDTEKRLLKSLAPIARSCNSSLFFAFVSHPKDWLNERQSEPVIYQWSLESDRWLLFAGKSNEKRCLPVE